MRTLEKRVSRLETRDRRSDPLENLSAEEGERFVYLSCKPANQLTVKESADLQSMLDRVSLGPSDKDEFASLSEKELVQKSQELTNQLAEFYPCIREFASEKTWAGQFESPGLCGTWCGVVRESDLPGKDRASELLRQRWRGFRLEPDQMEWLAKFLEGCGLDLGPEGPWLRDHLDGGFKPSE